MINNATASLNDVDDGLADEPANIPEATDSNKEYKRKNSTNKANWANHDQRGQESNLKPKHLLISKQNMPSFMN